MRKPSSLDFDLLLSRLSRIITFASEADRARFRTSIISDIERYQADLVRLHSGQIGNRIECLYKLACRTEANQEEAFDKLADEVAALPNDVIDFLMTMADGESLPLADDYRSAEARDGAVRNLLSLLRMGARRTLDRKRPTGKRSRSIVHDLRKPSSAGRGRKSKQAEEWFARWLSISYAEATEQEAPRVVHHNSASAFVRFVEECFESVGIETAHSSAVRAINAAGRGRPPLARPKNKK